MNQMLVAIVVGVVAAAGTVMLVDVMRTDAPAGTAAMVDLRPLEQRLDRIEAKLGKDGGGLATQGLPPELSARLERIEAMVSALRELQGASVPDAGVGGGRGPLQRIEDRLASIEESLSGDGPGPQAKIRKPAKRRVSLAEAADALELSGQEQDDLKRIYEDFQNKMFKIAAGKDGNPDDVRREVMEARDDPAKAAGLMSKYLPNVIGNIGGIMMAQQQREDAIRKAIGPEKAGRLQREFDVKEDNLLGLGGGGFRTDVSVGGGR